MQLPSRTSNPSSVIITPSSTHAEIELAEKVANFHYDPLGFTYWAYPWGEPGPLEKYEGPDNWQEDLLGEWGEEMKRNGFDGVNPVMPIRITRSSGHGIGKGVCGAFVVNFIMSTRPHCRGTVTANTYGQLETKTWATIQKWAKLCITAHWFTITGSLMYKTEHRETWFTAPISCAEENAQAFAGQHAADSTSFYLIDEGSNVPDSIYQVADGGLTDGEPMMFVWGNPTRRVGKFYRINFGEERKRWNHKAIDSRTTRFANKQYLKEMEEDFGVNSDRFRVQVLGLPPMASDLQFIPSDWVAAAKLRDVQITKTDPVICGLDISRGGADDCVFRFRRGRDARTIPPIVLPGEMVRDSTLLEAKALDILQNGAPLKALDPKYKQYNPEQGEENLRVRVDMLFVDGTGVGGPICDHLKAMGFRDRVYEVQFGADAPNLPGYQNCANMRSWMWELMRIWMQTGAIDKSNDLEMDLTAPMFTYRLKDNSLVLEAKESIKKRIGRSTDEADALALTFARPVAPRNGYVSSATLSGEDDSWESLDTRGRIWG